MNLSEIFRIAINSLMINRLRSALTTLGIVIGVGAVIGLVSLGRGVEDFIAAEFSDLGANVLEIGTGSGYQAAVLAACGDEERPGGPQAHHHDLRVPPVHQSSSGLLLFRVLRHVAPGELGELPEVRLEEMDAVADAFAQRVSGPGIPAPWMTTGRRSSG